MGQPAARILAAVAVLLAVVADERACDASGSVRSPANAGGWEAGGACCGAGAQWKRIASNLSATLDGRLADCAVVELQVSVAAGGARFDRVGCFWPAFGPGTSAAAAAAGALDGPREAFFGAEGVPRGVAAWATTRVAALERRRKCALYGYGSDGPRRSKVYVEEFSYDAGWQRGDRGDAPALEARLWDPAAGTAADGDAPATVARKRYEHLPAAGAAAQLSAALPYFARRADDAAAVAVALDGAGMYHVASSTADATGETANAAWTIRFRNSAAHADPASAAADAPRAAAQKALEAAAPALGRFLGVPEAACGGGGGGGSWAACAAAVVGAAAPGAFLNALQLSRANAAGEPYLVAYYTARAADPALYHHWNRACCRLSARPEDTGRCPGP